MSFKKRVSPTLVKAENRAKKLATIDPALDLGGLTLAAYQAEITQSRALLDDYNGLLTQADLESDEFDVLELRLKDLNERMLTGIATKFGKDSPQYEAAGGVRKSERKKPARKSSAG